MPESVNQQGQGTDAGGGLVLRWDIKNLEIKTRSVEKTLEPLVIQVNFVYFIQSQVKNK